jgi:hypothetical protein
MRLSNANSKWLDAADKLVGRPLSLFVAIAAAFSALWLAITKWFGVDSSLMLGTLVRDILPFALLYMAAALITVREGLFWFRRFQDSRRPMLAILFISSLVAIALLAHGDLRSRTRHSLIEKEVARIRLYGCNGDYQRSLEAIARLSGSPRFRFLKPDLEALANKERLLLHLKSGLRAQADGIMLAERRMLLGTPNRSGKPSEISDAVWRRWQAAIRSECSR